MTHFDAVILAAGDFPSHPSPVALLNHPRVVCCDSAAIDFLNSGRTPWRCIGDGDSLTDAYKEQCTFITVHEQETNDLSKAVRLIQNELGRTARVAILGATGKREDHTVGNISLLIDYMEMGIRPVMYTDHGVFIPCHGNCSFAIATDGVNIISDASSADASFVPMSSVGANVSIFNMGCTELSSQGLRYSLYPLKRLWQGTLNRMDTDQFSICGNADYLIYFTYC